MCPAAVITQPGNYVLAGDVGPCAPGTDGIDIEASNVKLHLNGHTIAGTACGGVFFVNGGIVIGLPAPAPMLSNVRVLGPGTISDFGHGVLAQNSAGSFAKFVTFICSTGAANGFVTLPPGGHWKLERNVVQQGGAPNDNFCSINLFTDDTDIVGNSVNSPMCIRSNSNTIVNNTANGGTNGIALIGSNNEVHANTTDNNIGLNGIWAPLGSTGNSITGNTSFNNAPFDMDDDNLNCDSNKWEGNRFNTTNQPSCVH